MTDPGYLELIHAEIDGELDARQRAELSRRLLADPAARSLRDDFQRLCKALDAVAEVEPPPQLRESILAALPPLPVRRAWYAPLQRWRYAAMVAGVVAAGALIYETVRGPMPATSEVVGTIALAPAAILVDAVQLANGPVSGRVSLYRDRAMLALRFEVKASPATGVQITSAGRTLRVDHIGQDRPPGTALTVALPGIAMRGQSVQVTFRAGDRTVGTATLRAPGGP